MNLNRFRSLLYRVASFLGDVNAVRKGKVVQRIVRKEATMKASKLINKIVKW